MKKEQGIKIANRMRSAGFTITGWSNANGFKVRTVNDVLYAEHGTKRGGKVTEDIISAFISYGFLDDGDHKQVSVSC